MRISVLDHSGVSEGHDPAEAIRDSLALAALCDTLGYHRYWVSEHHGSAGVAGTAPEVLLGALAATTRHMRLGSGGVMLPHYQPLKVAEQFRVLEAIAPGRIDLGIGRAPGSDGLTAQALNPAFGQAQGRDPFPGQLRDLMDWVAGRPLAEGHPFRAISAQPAGPGAPAVWMLGSSEYGAQVAAWFGLPYCFAHFFTPGPAGDARAAQAIALYREGFRPGAIDAPYAAAAVTATAAETRAAAAYQLGSRLLWSLRREQGVHGAFPDPELAATRAYAPAEQAWMEGARAAQIHGTGAEVALGLRALGAELEVDELFVVSTAYTPAVRHRSYALIADAMALAHHDAAAA